MTNKSIFFKQKRLYMYILFLLLLVLVVAFFGFFTLMEYRPAKLESLEVIKTPEASIHKLQKNQPIKVVTWNLGYGGLDALSDFILDGGTNVLARSKAAVEENLTNFAQLLNEENPNIIFLQEVDISSKRSYWLNQKAYFIEKLKKASATFALNFDAIYVPFPFPNMLGKIKGGILTLSDYTIEESVRHQLPGSFSWPKKTVYLKRCLTVNSASVADSDKKLYFINLHLSAYDLEDRVRPKEMDYLKNLILELYAQGHWVIAGGDWNAVFPGLLEVFEQKYKNDADAKWQKWQDWNSIIEEDFIDKNWHWVYDKNVDSLRDLNAAYKKGETLTTNVDGFLVSPNIDIKSVQTPNLEFKNSDHQPVFTQLELK